MSGLRYEQGTPVKRRKPRARAWCMKLAAWIMVGSSGLVGESAGPGRSVHEDAGRGLAAAACDQQRLADGFLPCLGGQVALLGPFEFGGVLEAEDFLQRCDGGLDREQALAGVDLAGRLLHGSQG